MAAAGIKPVTKGLCVLRGTISGIKVGIILTFKWRADNMIARTGEAHRQKCPGGKYENKNSMALRPDPCSPGDHPAAL